MLSLRQAKQRGKRFAKVNIVDNAPKQSSASRVVTEVASRQVQRRIARHASWLLNWYRGMIDVSATRRASRGRTYG